VLKLSAEAVSPSNVIDVAKYYSSIGIISQPLYGPSEKCTSPGKQPIFKKWSVIEKPFSDWEIGKQFSNDRNLGFLCGQRSDLTVWDVDSPIKGILDYVLRGEDTSKWVKQSHTDNKWHWLFRYSPDIKAGQYQGLGFDILSDAEKEDRDTGLPYIAGNNCAAFPSIHPDGNMYQLAGNIKDRTEIPTVVLTRIKRVIDLYTELTTKILPNCREPFSKLFNAVFVDKQHKLYKQTSIFRGTEGRTRHLHLCAELKANGADEDHLKLVSALIFGDGYDKVLTRRELAQVNEAYTAKTESIKVDPILSQFYVERKKAKAKQEPEKIEKIAFDMIGDRVLDKYHIFTLRDTEQMYIYENGIYNSQIAKTRLNTIIRQEFKDCYLEIWQELNPDDEPDKIPAAASTFVKETLAYIQAYTYKIRDDIDQMQGQYINLKNGLFNLETWELEPHNPEYLSIQQIPITFDKNGTCPKIEQFLNQVLTPQDVTLTLEWIGYLLTPDTSHQKALIFYGDGGNGKSVLLDSILKYIGDGNCSNESLHDLEKNNYSVANLYGKLVNVCADLPSKALYEAPKFKQLVGKDKVRGEEKYKNAFYFRNKARLMFSANVLPGGKKDFAFFRRLMLIHCPNQFLGDKENKNLINELTTDEEMSGLLNLALIHLKQLRENGKFSYTKSVEDVQHEYTMNSDPVAVFLEECTEPSDDDCKYKDMYDTYKKWAEGKGMKPLANNIFAQKMRALGCKGVREDVTIQCGNESVRKKVGKWLNIDINDEWIWAVDV